LHGFQAVKLCVDSLPSIHVAGCTGLEPGQEIGSDFGDGFHENGIVDDSSRLSGAGGAFVIEHGLTLRWCGN
jgi:hypothetical protein